jgi:hypothetical protein
MNESVDVLASIRATLTAYNIAGDRLHLNELAATFTEDGVLETPLAVFHGRDEIKRGLAGGVQDRAQRSSAHSPRLSVVRHHLTTSQIEFEGATVARARSYFLVYSDIGPDHAGVYVDRLADCGGRWLLTHRRVLIDWVADESLFTELREAHRRRLESVRAAKATEFSRR